MKYRIVKKIEFCYGHRLMDYVGKCARIHGHNAVVEIELGAEQLDACGMVRDFSVVKSDLKGFIDKELDHRTLLRIDDPLVAALRSVGEEPFLMEVNPTAENIAELIYNFAQSTGLPVINVRIWETPNSCASCGE